MRRRLAILAGLACLATGAEAQTTRVCETAFRQCVAECGGGAPGACTQGCYAERALCIQNPSRPPSQSRLQR